MANSFDLSVNVRNANPSANIDFYYGTYPSKEAACAAVPIEVRMIGKTVGIIENGAVSEYWWKSGITDADLVLKFAYNTVIEGYTGTFTNLGSANRVEILKTTHLMGDNPLVQCWVNGEMTLFDITNDDGDITVSWTNVGEITDNDVLNVFIVSADYRYDYNGGNPANSFTILKSAHECGDNPFVQCWLDGKLALFDIANNSGDITVSWGEDIDPNDGLFVVFNADVYVDVFTNPNQQYSLTIEKETHGKENPIVQCWLDGKLALLDIENNDGDITITWTNETDISALTPLTVIIAEQKTESVTHEIKDLVVIGERREGDGGITPTVGVGGVAKGVFIEKDRLLNKLLRDMLTPTLTPTITPPTATIETSATAAQRLLKVGQSIQTSIWINYGRGEITLDGVVQGHTAGEATEYTFDDGVTTTTDSDNSITPVIQRDTECVVTYTGSVTHDEGDQPYDSEHHKSGSKMPSGTINTSNGVSFEFVYPIYANTDAEHLNVTYEQPIVSKSQGYVEITFPLQHGGTVDRYTFEIPSSMNVTEIKYFNTFAIRYEPENRLNDFKVVNTDKNGVPYKRYTYKNNTYMEQNTFKIIWENNI